AGGDQVTVEAAYAEVERLTRREARNFAYGIMVLPRPKRQAIAAIYAFALRDPPRCAARARGRRSSGHRAESVRGLRRAARLLPPGRGRRRRCLRGGVRLGRGRARGDARRRAP